MKEGQQDSLTTREKEIQVQTQMDIISGYYRKIGLTPEITIEYILQMLEADLQYIRESNAVISVEKIINSDSIPSSSVAGEEWISLKEYEQKVLQLLADKPVIKMLVQNGLPFEKWGNNINNLIDKELGATRELRVKMPSSVTGESEAIGERKFTLKEAIDIWKACYDWNHDPESPDNKEYFKQTFGIDI